jgi:alkyl sulfatase BDS1-like metallo-beta-lactamase superfamily hydrolase
MRTGLAALLLSLAACGGDDNAEDYHGFTEPSAATVAHNRAVARSLPLDDPDDFEQAHRGLIASAEGLAIPGADGDVIWDIPAYQFVDGDAPDSVNPSLWRQERLNNIRGLFEVAPNIYQLRGFDLANMSIIVGDTGWIIVDPLTARETASAALAFASQHLEPKPVRAILFTHSHIDHFGGALGIATAEEVRRRGIAVIAPEGFMEAATQENVIAGVAMGRRAGFMYGRDLPRNARGHVGSGLGSEPALGRAGILQPTDIIRETGEERVIDGVRMVFQNVPGSEAPAEFTFYLPQHKAFMGAELVSRNMHNIYSLRGAHVRDALRWSKYIDEAAQRFAEAEVYFASHHWPVWGRQSVQDFLSSQRDTYKYLHDQTVRLLNQGYTGPEIAEQLTLPPALQRTFASRGYYGTVRHNARAVYQMYMGWYDGNPANLNPLPPQQASVRYVEAMGGADAVIERAREAHDEGDYRWAAELLNRVVFADPDDQEAKSRLAATYDQMAYQAESAPWRDVYLSAAWELRYGRAETGVDIAKATDLLANTSVDKFFDAMAVRLNGPEAAEEQLVVEFEFTDLGERHRLEISNGVLHHRRVAQAGEFDAALVLTRPMFDRLVMGDVGLKDTLFADDLNLEGSKLSLLSFFRLFEQPNTTFPIVTP